MVLSFRDIASDWSASDLLSLCLESENFSRRRRLVGAKAIKLGSWDKHPAYC